MGLPALLLLSLAAWAADRPEASWPREETAHFVVSREGLGVAAGENSLLERLHQDLHRELWELVPWMDSEKVRVYLYADRDSYLAGSFKPAPWSAGLVSEEGGVRSLALPEPVEAAVAAHELSHLYLHSFFRGGKAPPPPWLDEGLAGLLQEEALTLPDPQDKGPVLPSPMPLERLVKSRPARDEPEARVGLWYRQAASLVRFLKRERGGSAFASLCRGLKDGQPLDAALSKAYGYADLSALESAWLAWRPRKPRGLPVGLE